MNIGFTGTQRGMTSGQLASLGAILSTDELWYFHHGDCIGADAEAHEIAWASGHGVVLHPPSNSTKRAHCQGASLSHKPKPYLIRNHDIVDACDILIAAPGERSEVMRSGTWATIRYARRTGKPVVLLEPEDD